MLLARAGAGLQDIVPLSRSRTLSLSRILTQPRSSPRTHLLRASRSLASSPPPRAHAGVRAWGAAGAVRRAGRGGTRVAGSTLCCNPEAIIVTIRWTGLARANSVFQVASHPPSLHCIAGSSRSFTALRKDAGLCCGSRLLEGRSVCLCWAPSKPKGPKGAGVRALAAGEVRGAGRDGSRVAGPGRARYHGCRYPPSC